MKTVVLVLLIALAVGVAIGFGIQLDPGYIRISWMNWLIETNIWIGLIAFLIFYLLFNFAFKALLRTIAIRSGYANFMGSVGRRRARKRTARGMLEFAEGQWRKAQRHLIAGAVYGDAPVVNYLTAAQAASEQGQLKTVKQLLQRAEDCEISSPLAVSLTEARLLLQQGEHKEAIAVLSKLHDDQPRHAVVLRLLLQAHLDEQNWGALADLLPKAERAGVVKAEDRPRLQREVWEGVLRSAIQRADNEPSADASLATLQATWKQIPAAVRQGHEAVLLYAQGLSNFGAHDEAEALLKRNLDRHWHDQWVLAYGTLACSDAASQYRSAKTWLRSKENDPDLLLTLGRLALRMEDWNEAEAHLTRSFELRRNAETAAELGRLLSHLGRAELANQYYAQSMDGLIKLPKLPHPPADNKAHPTIAGSAVAEASTG